jgi:hypothetical protein
MLLHSVEAHTVTYLRPGHRASHTSRAHLTSGSYCIASVLVVLLRKSLPVGDDER